MPSLEGQEKALESIKNASNKLALNLLIKNPTLNGENNHSVRPQWRPAMTKEEFDKLPAYDDLPATPDPEQARLTQHLSGHFSDDDAHGPVNVP